MSRKRINKTINPQVAVQDYLNDLLQQPISSSPLEKLKQEEEENQQKLLAQKAQKLEASKAAKLAAAKQKQLQADARQKAESRELMNSSAAFRETPQSRGESTYSLQNEHSQHNAAYNGVSSRSLASQRLEEKRALARAPEKQFREPIALKSSLALSRMLKAVPPHELTEQTLVSEAPKPTEHKSQIDHRVSEKGHEPNSLSVGDKELTQAVIQEPVQPLLGLSEAKQSIDKREATYQSVEAKALSTKDTSSPAQNVDEQAADGEPEASVEPTDQWLDNGRPEWAQGRFECLIFTVAGLKLAVPLVSLGAIHAMEHELTPLVGRPSWFLGLLPVASRNVRVVDSAQWIMPERYNDKVKDNYRFVIRLDNSEWGMACDSVAQSFSIAPEEVRWRTDRGKRPWLAGTVIDHMCALMDVAAVSRLLDTAEKTNLSPI